MLSLLVQWVLYAVALLIVSRIVPGFTVVGLWPALIAALVIGLLNATLGFFLKVITFPLSIITSGSVFAGDQRADDPAGFEHRARLSCARIYSGVLGRGGAGAAGHGDSGGDEERRKFRRSKRRRYYFSSLSGGIAGCAWRHEAIRLQRGRFGKFDYASEPALQEPVRGEREPGR